MKTQTPRTTRTAPHHLRQIACLTLAAILLAACAAPALPPTATPQPTSPPIPTATLDAIAAAVATQGPIPTATARPTLEPAAAMAQLDQIFAGPAEEGNFAGAVMVVRDGQVLLEKAYGLSDQAQNLPNTTETKFRIFSITKTFTAIAILMLQKQGKLDVQASACEYVPDCPDHWQPITLHHLLSHTSGLQDCNCPADVYLPERVATPVALVDHVGFYRDAPLLFEPGTRYRYSNASYVVLGYIIEQVSGQKYADFLRQNIFEPLDMANTGIDEDLDGLALGYTEGRPPLPVEYEDVSWGLGAGGLYSTLEDLYRFDQALYTDALLPAAAREAMFTGHVRIQAELGVAAGYGMVRGMHGAFNNESVIWKDGCCYGFTSFLGRFVEDDVTVIILTNRNHDWTTGAVKLALDVANLVVVP